MTTFSLTNSSHKFEFLANLKSKKKNGCMPIITEVKAYKPLSGDLLKGRTVASIASCYEDGGAACLSVVTGKWFGGSIELLRELVKYSSLPILRKDFITNRRQIEQSKSDGAAAILLTKQLFSRKHFYDLIDYTLSIGLTPFVEISDKIETVGLNLPSEAIIAVNNKNIQNKEIGCANIMKSLKLVEACRDTGAGIVASASGISTHDQVEELYNAGFDALLIGSALLESSDIRCTLNDFCFISEQKGSS